MRIGPMVRGFVLLSAFFCFAETSLAVDTTVRSTRTNSATTGTAVSITAPAGTAAGDVVIVLVHVNGQTTIVDNNGSTPFTEDINDWKPNTTSGMTVSIFSRRIQSGDPTTYNFTSGASGRWSVIAITFQDPDPSTIYDVTPNTANGANTDSPPAASSVVVPSITTTTDKAIHVTTAYQDGSVAGTVTYPTSYINTVSTGLRQQVSASTLVITSAGATGTTTYSWNRSDAVMGISFAIKNNAPGGGGGGAPHQLTTLGCCGVAMQIDDTNLVAFPQCDPEDAGCTQGVSVCLQDPVDGSDRCFDLSSGDPPVRFKLWKQTAAQRLTSPVGVLLATGPGRGMVLQMQPGPPLP